MDNSTNSTKSVATNNEYFLHPLDAKLVRDHVFRIVLFWGTVISLLFGLGGYAFLSMWRDNVETRITSDLESSITTAVKLEAEKDIETFTARMESVLKEEEVAYRNLLVSRLADSLQEAAVFAKRTEDDSKKISVILAQASKADQDLEAVRSLLAEIETNRSSIAQVLLEDESLRKQLITIVEKSVTVGLTWEPLALTGSWLRYSDGYHEPSYAIDSNGVVHFRGLIKVNQPPPGNIQRQIIIAKLPDELAPSHRALLTGLSGGNTIARIDVGIDSSLNFMQGNLAWVSLDNLSYSIKPSDPE